MRMSNLKAGVPYSERCRCRVDITGFRGFHMGVRRRGMIEMMVSFRHGTLISDNLQILPDIRDKVYKSTKKSINQTNQADCLRPLPLNAISIRDLRSESINQASASF